jgi:hypothetical protein
MYLNSAAGGSYHIWRQGFPDGPLSQITSGPTEEEGIAMAPEGQSFITSVGVRKSAVWVHDAEGERQISLEGFAYQPKFTPDGKRVCYRVLKGASPASDASELWIADLESGRNEQLLPGIAVIGNFAYDISADGRQIVVESRDREGKQRLWVASMDRRSPPREIPNIEGRTPLFGPGGEIFFAFVEPDSKQPRPFAYEIRHDGTGLRKVVEQPIGGVRGVSPDGRWLIVWTGGNTIAFPVHSGAPVRICNSDFRLKWSVDRNSVWLSRASTGLISSGAQFKTYVIPLAAGQMLPSIPLGGFGSEEEIAKVVGVKVEDRPDAPPVRTPEQHVFPRETLQRNLFRIPRR